MTSIFVAGIIQGSRSDKSVHSQDYRGKVVPLLREAFPRAEVYCPIENHPASLDFTDERARRTFFGLMERAGRADVLVAYVPEASMGTAVEMWRAHGEGRLVVTISPLAANWVVRFCSDVVVPDLSAFEALVRSGRMARLLADRGLLDTDGL